MKLRAAWMTLFAVLAIAPAAAQEIPDEVKTKVRAFSLDAGSAGRLLDALEQLTAYTLGQPDWQKKVAASMKAPWRERVAGMEADAGTMKILRAHGMGAEEYGVALLALRGAVMASRGGTEGIAALASPAHLSFVKANPAIVARLEKIDAGAAPRPR